MRHYLLSTVATATTGSHRQSSRLESLEDAQNFNMLKAITPFIKEP